MKRLILIGFLLATTHLFAQSAATVLYTQNKVMVNQNGAEHTLARGAKLEPGAEIITASDAAAHIQYTNGTLVNIGSNTHYKILAYSPKQADVQIKADLSHGKVEIQNQGKIKETLKTPIVSLAILGTHIRVYVPNHQVTYIQVIEGLVLARNEYLRMGDSVRVTADQIVTVPFPEEGLVVSPLASPGKIEEGVYGVFAESGSGGSIGAQIVDFLVTNQVVGASTTSGIIALQQGGSGLIPISLVCN